MKFIISVFFLFLTTFAMVNAQSFAYKTLLKGVYDSDFPVIYPDNDSLIGKAVLLDTREKREFEVSHLENAKWVGYETFDLEVMKTIPKDQVVIVYCSIGARSQEIGKKLQSAGYTQVYNLYGGIFHWVNEGKPVHNQNGATNAIHPYSKTWGIWLTRGVKQY
ncbi:rhodanese-like domain-containing protein [Belliella pelovolcani]|nr:rhodanese-like domain-containing protein [Belliella pelovolcani]